MSINDIDLRTARLINGYTQKELAKVVGVHAQTIADWEKSPNKVPMSAAKIIIETLNADYNIFFNNNSTKRR